MAWKTIIEDDNWEYSDEPNVDRRSFDTYDYDLNAKHVNGIRYNKEGDKIYVLSKQINVPHPGYGEYVVAKEDLKEDMLAFYSNKLSDDGTKFIDQKECGLHEATKAVSLKFSGAQYGKLIDDTGADTSITLVGDFTLILKFKNNTNGPILGQIASNDNRLLVYTSTAVISIAGGYFELGVPVPTGVAHTLILQRVGSTLSASIDNSSPVYTAVNGEDFTFDVLGAANTMRFNGNIWDIRAEDSIGVKFSNSLAQKSDTGYIESEVGPAIQLTGFTLPDDFTESVEYGHSWNTRGFSEVENLTPDSEDLTSWIGGAISRTQLSDGWWQLTTLIDGGSIALRTPSIPFANLYCVIELRATSASNSVDIGFWDADDSGIISGPGTIHPSIPSRIQNLSETETTKVWVYRAVANEPLYIYPGTYSVLTSGESILVRFPQVTRDLSLAYVKTTDHPISGKIPEDPSKKGYDVAGGALTNPGTAQQNLKVYGFTGNFDGATHGLPTSTIVFSGDFAIETVFNLTTFTNGPAFAGNSPGTNRVRVDRSTSQFLVRLAGGSEVIFDIHTFVTGVPYKIEFSRAGNTGTLAITRLTDFEVFTQSLTVPIGAVTIDRVFCYESDNVYGKLSGTCPHLKLYGPNGAPAHHWVCQSSKTSMQTTIYDVAGSNHVTLVGATLPFFTKEMEGSHLLQHGFSGPFPDGVELWENPTTQTIDVNNYSTYNPITGVGRIVSDGAAVELNVFSSMTPGNKYQIIITDLVASSGAIKIQEITLFDGVAETEHILANGAHEIVVSSTRISIRRYTACDVTFKLSVQKLTAHSDSTELWDDTPYVSENITKAGSVYTCVIGGTGNENRIYEAIKNPYAYFQVSFDVTQEGEFHVYDELRSGYVNMGTLSVGRHSLRGKASILYIKLITAGAQMTNVSLQIIPEGLIPASTETPTESILGQPLTNQPGQISYAPVELEMIESLESYQADAEEHVSAIDLVATISGTTEDNNIIDLGENTYRWIGDGSTFSYIRFYSAVLGRKYRIIPTVINHSAGAIKGNDAADSDLFVAFTSTPDPIDDIITNKIEFGRSISGQAIDITVNFSVQEFNDPINIWFEAGGTPKRVLPLDIETWPDGDTNNQYFYSSFKSIVDLREIPQDPDTTAEIKILHEIV